MKRVSPNCECPTPLNAETTGEDFKRVPGSPNAMLKSVAIVGATGAVGQEMVRLLGERLAQYADVRLFSSVR